MPAPITRDSAQTAAQLELSKRAYHTDDPSTIQRVVRWLLDRINDMLDAAARHSPGQGIGLMVIVVLIVLVVVAISVRVGRLRRAVRAAQPILGGEIVMPADHRRRAAAFAREQRWADAVREWLRAITRELEERGVLDPRPGRTAAELCAEASANLPALAQDLRRATSVFDAVWYGGRSARADDEKLLRALDQRVGGSHRALTASTPAVAP